MSLLRLTQGQHYVSLTSFNTWELNNDILACFPGSSNLFCLQGAIFSLRSVYYIPGVLKSTQNREQVSFPEKSILRSSFIPIVNWTLNMVWGGVKGEKRNLDLLHPRGRLQFRPLLSQKKNFQNVSEKAQRVCEAEFKAHTQRKYCRASREVHYNLELGWFLCLCGAIRKSTENLGLVYRKKINPTHWEKHDGSGIKEHTFRTVNTCCSFIEYN